MGRLRWVWIALVFVWACADDDVGPADAATIIDAKVWHDDPWPPPDVDIVDPVPDVRTGIIEVLEVTAGTSTGGLVRIELADVAPDVAPAYDDIVPPGQGCRVTVYDLTLGQARGPFFDEGDVIITGTTQALPTCSFDTDTYRCIDQAITGGAGDSFTTVALMPAMSIAGASFTSNNVGMVAEVTGASEPANNGSFAIVDVVSSTVAHIDHPGLVVSSAEGASIEITAGHGPVGVDVTLLPTDAPIVVSKAAGAETEAFSTPLTPGGLGYRLDTTSTQVDAIPLDGTGVVFSCTTDGECGGGIGTEVSMEATDAANTRLARLDCRYFTRDAAVPGVAMATLLGDDDADVASVRTLVRRVSYFSATNLDGINEILVSSGHGYVGWTDR